MSSRKLRIEYSPEARDDIIEILRYTERTWGRDQRERYESAIKRVLQRLSEFRSLGRERPDLGPNLRSFVIQQYIVIFEVFENRLHVARLIHTRRDLNSDMLG
jgi:toxin ParE1/3/4